MITRIQAALLTARCYDAAFVASGVVPDLSDLGFIPTAALWGVNARGKYPYGFLAVPEDGSGGQILCSRGTDNLGDALTDGQIRLLSSPWRGGVGRVHAGFSSLAASFGWGPDMSDLLAPIPSLAKLTLAGHSEGAAAVRQLTMRLGHVGQLYTWGEPRSCDGAAAAYAFTCVNRSERVANPQDPVPKVPDWDLLALMDPYRHVGDGVSIGSWGSIFEPGTAHGMATYVAAELAAGARKAA